MIFDRLRKHAFSYMNRIGIFLFWLLAHNGGLVSVCQLPGCSVVITWHCIRTIPPILYFYQPSGSSCQISRRKSCISSLPTNVQKLLLHFLSGSYKTVALMLDTHQPSGSSCQNSRRKSCIIRQKVLLDNWLIRSYLARGAFHFYPQNGSSWWLFRNFYCLSLAGHTKQWFWC